MTRTSGGGGEKWIYVQIVVDEKQYIFCFWPLFHAILFQ